MGTAGESARREAESVARAAERLERKATNARSREAAFRSGAAGEEAVARELGVLAEHGWFSLHDRAMPTGGNIDHIVIGPGAVIVLDAKAWNSQLEVRGDRLYASGWNKSKESQRLAEQAAAVRSALGGDVPVDRALVITTQPDLPAQAVGETGLLGIGSLRAEIGATPARYGTVEVERMVHTLLDAFPSADERPPSAMGLRDADPAAPNSMFDRSTRVLYLNDWRKNGLRRLYLNDEFGDALGWKDVHSDELRLEHSDDDLARVVLGCAQPNGLPLDQRMLPKVPVDLPGGRLFGWIGRVYSSVLVGNLWSARGKRHLYGTWANPVDGVFPLGYVDLNTGWVKPATEGPIAKDRASAERYLAVLRDRHPDPIRPPRS